MSVNIILNGNNLLYSIAQLPLFPYILTSISTLHSTHLSLLAHPSEQETRLSERELLRKSDQSQRQVEDSKQGGTVNGQQGPKGLPFFSYNKLLVQCDFCDQIKGVFYGSLSCRLQNGNIVLPT